MSYKLEKPYTYAERADFVIAHQGLNYYEDDNCIIMYLNTEKIVDGEAIDISQTPEYIAEQKAIAKQSVVKEYADIFKEFDRICGAKFSRGLCTTSEITAQRDILDDELTQKLEEIENG